MAAEHELNTWKEIAGYFGKSVRTVQEWERKQGLPVQRLGETGQITASTAELDAWRESRLVSRVPAAAPVSPKRHRFKLLAIGGAAVIALALGLVLVRPRNSRTPASFVLNGRQLAVFDAHNELMWEHIFPQPFVYSRVTNFDTWPSRHHKFFDAEARGRVGLLFGANDLLYCFRNDGTIAWTHQPGRPVMTRRGSPVPGDYTIEFVRALSKPRRDGGQIILGAHRGPGALFVVEILTRHGVKVGEYFHYGWFFNAQTGVLGRGGSEDIFLTGVDNVTGNDSNYGATLVVLEQDKVQGQATTLARDERALADIPAAQEKAVVLIKEFAPNPDPPRYCHGDRMIVAAENLELFVTQGEAQPSAHFIFDSHLRLQDVIPDLYLIRALEPSVLAHRPSGEWPALFRNVLGDVRYVRNSFQ